jgi:hypothetical protein
MVTKKLTEWLKRYVPAEVFAFIGAVTGGLAGHYLFHNEIVTALCGTWGENVGFYGKILYRDVQERRKRDEKITGLGMLKVLRNTVVEFGIAEYLDSFLIRPFAMYFFPRALGNVALGLVVGKFAADITFYFPTIFFYEVRKKYLKD